MQLTAMICFRPAVGPRQPKKMAQERAPMWPKRSPRQAQDSPKTAQDRPKMAQVRHEMAQDRPKTAEARPKTSQNRLKTTQNRPQLRPENFEKPWAFEGFRALRPLKRAASAKRGRSVVGERLCALRENHMVCRGIIAYPCLNVSTAPRSAM